MSIDADFGFTFSELSIINTVLAGCVVEVANTCVKKYASIYFKIN